MSCQFGAASEVIESERGHPKRPLSRDLQSILLRGVDDRIRTGDRLDHNQELYQLSYVHRVASI
jgi:hypothetical protein